MCQNNLMNAALYYKSATFHRSLPVIFENEECFSNNSFEEMHSAFSEDSLDVNSTTACSINDIASLTMLNSSSNNYCTSCFNLPVRSYSFLHGSVEHCEQCPDLTVKEQSLSSCNSHIYQDYGIYNISPTTFCSLNVYPKLSQYKHYCQNNTEFPAHPLRNPYIASCNELVSSMLAIYKKDYLVNCCCNKIIKNYYTVLGNYTAPDASRYSSSSSIFPTFTESTTSDEHTAILHMSAMPSRCNDSGSYDCEQDQKFLLINEIMINRQYDDQIRIIECLINELLAKLETDYNRTRVTPLKPSSRRPSAENTKIINYTFNSDQDFVPHADFSPINMGIKSNFYSYLIGNKASIVDEISSQLNNFKCNKNRYQNYSCPGTFVSRDSVDKYQAKHDSSQINSANDNNNDDNNYGLKQCSRWSKIGEQLSKQLLKTKSVVPRRSSMIRKFPNSSISKNLSNLAKTQSTFNYDDVKNEKINNKGRDTRTKAKFKFIKRAWTNMRSRHSYPFY
ncbi:hypothetical protein GJ496_012007 [Pomphorhynchus laevis]|nr:hypothetical protein GJ496_012007 [Pomphorhynchus laevis]